MTKAYLYARVTWVGVDWVGFSGTSILVGYLMPNPLYIYVYTLNIYDLVRLGFMAYQHSEVI